MNTKEDLLGNQMSSSNKAFILCRYMTVTTTDCISEPPSLILFLRKCRIFPVNGQEILVSIL